MSDIPSSKPIPDYGDLFTIEHFVELCKDGMFIDYDGSGNYSDGTVMYDKAIYPSDVTKDNYDKQYSHVVWFNR